MQDVQRVRQVGRGERVLVQEPDGSRGVGAGDVVVLVGAGVDHDVLAGVARMDRARCVDAVADRHADVHQHDVGCVLLAEPNRFVSVRCAADEDEPPVFVEDALDELGELIVVFGDKDAERCLGHDGEPATGGP